MNHQKTIPSFDFELKDIEFYTCGFQINQQLASTLIQLEGMQYSLSCKSEKNNYQLSSDFDKKLEQ